MNLDMEIKDRFQLPGLWQEAEPVCLAEKAEKQELPELQQGKS